MILLVFISISSVSADDIYVGANTTADGDGSFENPYNNLQLAIDHANDDSKINIMEGNYSGAGNSNLTIAKNNLTIQSYNNGKVIFKQSGSGAPVRFFNITGDNIVINGLTFINGISMAYEDTCGSEVVISGNNVVVNNSVFAAGISQSGTLYVTGSNTIVENSVFTGNIVNAGDGGAIWAKGENLTVLHSQFLENIVNNGAGGAIYFEGTNLLVDSSTFNGNNISAKKGGAIYAKASNVKIINSNFLKQTANSGNGGAVCVEGVNLTVIDSKFVKNSANGGYGGAIKFNGTSLDISNSQFINNTAQGRSGAAIYSEAGKTAKLNNTYFYGNQAWNGAGGAIYNIGGQLIVNNMTATNQVTTLSNGAGVIYTEGDCNVTNSNFTSNYGYAGVGAIHQKDGDLYVDNTIFDKNQGWNREAGAIMTENSTIVINNSQFKANTAGNMGGAIYAKDSTGSIDNCNFTQNTANNGAGSLHLIGNDFKIRNNTFTNTTKWTVGYIIVRGNNTLVDNCNFSDTSSANSMGGAIAAYGDNVTITNSNMKNINSSSVGGMIYVIGDNFYMDNDTLDKSTSNYGAIFVRGNNTVINHTNISNTLMNYGAVHIKGNNFTFVNSNMYNCDDSSYGNGGGIFWSGNYFGPVMHLSGLTIDNCTFIDCDGEGGVSTAVSAFGDNIEVTNSEFVNCTAPYAGALKTSGNNQTIENCTFTGNYAQVQGGAVVIGGNNISIQSCNFTDNHAKLWAGAILSSATNVTVDDCIFVNNTSPDGGSILLLSGRNVNITNNIFANVSMTGYGGGIENRIKTSSRFNDTSEISVHIFDNVFENLHVSGDGGGILNYGAMADHNLTMINCTADGKGHDIMNYGVTGPANLILDEKPRYLYVGETSWVPVDLVDDNGNPITVNYLTGIVSENNTNTTMGFNFIKNEGGETGFNMTFNKVGEYVFTPHLLQNNVLINPGNVLKIIVTDRMPVEMTLPNITAYPHDRVNYTFNITNPNGELIRNGTVTITINNDEFVIEINGTNKTAKVTNHHTGRGGVPDSVYIVDYEGSITLRNIGLYDNLGVYNVTAYYNNVSDYYNASSAKGSITILKIPTTVPSINIHANVRDNITFSIDVLPELGNSKVGGNVSFYLPGVLVSNFISQNRGLILAINNLEGYEGLLFTVKIRQNLTLTLPVEMNGTAFPIFYYGDRVFEPSIAEGKINLTVDRNPTEVHNITIYVDVNTLFNLTIDVTSEKYIVDENVVRVIFATEPTSELLSSAFRYYDVPINNGHVVRMMMLNTPGVYSNNVIYVGGQSFLPSNGVVTIIVGKVNLNISVPTVNAHPGDVVNITVNLTDKFGNKVLNGTVNTTVDGKPYSAEVSNGSATFTDVLVGNNNGTFNFTVDYAENDYYNSTNATGKMILTKINTTVTAVDIIGYPNDDKTLNITLKDIYGNPIDGIIKITYINGSETEINIHETAIITLPNPGNYTMNVTYGGNNRYLPSNATINVEVLKIPTTVTANDISGKVGEIIDIEAIVKDSDGNPIESGNATLIIDGITYEGNVTDGVALFKDVILPNPGVYEVNITYNGNDVFESSNTTVNVSVMIDTNITADNVTGYEGDEVDIIAYILDEFGNPVDGGWAILEIGDRIGDVSKGLAAAGEYVSQVKDGKAIFKRVTLPAPGIYKAYLIYEGYGNYNPSEGLMYINVLAKNSNSSSDVSEKDNSTNNVDDSDSDNQKGTEKDNGAEGDNIGEYSENNLSNIKTGNPILVILLVLFVLASNTILRNKK